MSKPLSSEDVPPAVNSAQPGTPSEGTDRFRPTRAGIINLWDYRDEEFVFADGRLVLRGPNGSGKTKALEVLYPFVLDGRIEPRRLNPFAGEERTMKSNLLYRGQDGAHAYVWMEFGRSAGHSPPQGGDGAATPVGEFVTIGIGLRAQRHRDRVDRWYFVTDGRVGVNFSLLGPDDRPLTKRQLADQLGGDALSDRPAEYRAAVNARLFGLGAERYEQMLTLVLTLRRPQLAKNLDPKGLSRALTDGLRPLDDDLIAEAAHSFGDMETVQHTLTNLVAADEAATAFLTDYTTYLRAHGRAAADALTERTNRVNAAATALAGVMAERQAAQDDRKQAESGQREAVTAVTTAQARLEALQSSSAYRGLQQLDNQARLVDQLAGETRAAAERATVAAEALARREAEHESTLIRLGEARAALERSAAALAEAAADAGIDWSVEDADSTDVHIRATARAAQRDEDVASLREAHRQQDRARADRDHAREVLLRAEYQLNEAESQLTEAESALERARQSAADAVADWILRHGGILRDAAGPAVATALPPALADALPRIGTPDGGTLTARFDELTADADRDLRDEATRHRGELAQLRQHVDELTARRDAIADQTDDAPPPFAARTATRDNRAGAPLWRLVRFADHVADADRAGIEAALHAANLLDAWVDPGDDADAVPSETVLRPLPERERPAGTTLNNVLVPDDPIGVPTARVAAILASIRLEPHWTNGAVLTEHGAAPSISPTGWFATGLQVGSHAAATADYIGATARAARRARRIAELDEQIREQRAAADELTGRIDTIVALLTALHDARADLPATGDIVTARQHVDSWSGQVSARRDTVRSAEAAADQALTALAAADDTVRRTAAERNVAADPAGVDAIAASVRLFTQHAGDLVRRRDTAAERHQQLDTAVRELDTARSNEHDVRAAAATAAGQQAAREEELATLRAAIGQKAEQVQADIERTRRDIKEAARRSSDAQEAVSAARECVARAETACAAAVQTLRSALQECRREADRLRPFAATDLHPLLRLDAVPAWPAAAEAWPDPDAVADRAAREAGVGSDGPVTALPTAVSALHAALLAATSELRPTESSLKSSSTRVSSALGELEARLSAAGHDYKPEWNNSDGIVVVQVADEGGYTSISAFAERISAARRDQEQLLTESERRILEDALLGRLAQQIHERTLDARDLISRMSTEMSGRRMSSGAAVGIRWELADGLDEDQRQICQLLDRDAAQLNSDQLSRMRTHFAGRIKNLRAARPDRSYPDVLAEALDYRAWRTFVLTLTPPGGTAERLTQARHSTLSGGEQSVSLHLPLFAAAHVMLSSAAAASPRLVAMDEAFAGIDEAGRSELLGLTAQFDLDLFMTGHDLWATFATVPACAHYDLSHSAIEHTVSALLLLWDGGRLQMDGPSDDLAASLGSPGTRRATVVDEPMLEGS